MRKQKLSESRINAAKQHRKTAEVIKEEFAPETKQDKQYQKLAYHLHKFAEEAVVSKHPQARLYSKIANAFSKELDDIPFSRI